MKVVSIEDASYYYDGLSYGSGYTVRRWDGESETTEHADGVPYAELVAMIDPVARDAWQEWAYAHQQAAEAVRDEMRDTECRLNYAYHVGRDRIVRTIKGRKLPVGTVTRCFTNAVQSNFNRYTHNVNTDAGWIDTDNLECLPTAGDFPAEMRCPGCEKVRPAADYVFSGWEGFGKANRGVEWCRFCAAASYANTDHGTDAHTLALAVLAGDLTAVCPLIDELIAAGEDQRADELRRIHKLDKPARKPRKRKADAVTAAV